MNELAQAVELLKTHRADVMLVTFVECLIFALVILLPLQGNHFVGVRRWARFLGYTFAVLAAIYLVRLTALLWHVPGGFAAELIRYILSGLSNLSLFITAIFIQQEIDERGVLTSLKSYRWTLLLLITTSVIAVFGVYVGRQDMKALDFIGSSFVLFYFGWVLFQELSFRRNTVVALVALLSSLFYVLIFLGNLAVLIVSFIQPIEADADLKISSVLMTASLVLKAGLFFPAYLLATSTSNELQEIRALLKDLTFSRKTEFLESEGILRKINEILGAEVVRLFIRLPGQNRELVSIYENPAPPEYEADTQKKPRIVSLKDQDASLEICKRVFSDDDIIVVYDVNKYQNTIETEFADRIHPNSSMIGVPIKCYGAVIGCLEVHRPARSAKPYVLRRLSRFSKTDVLQAKRISVLLTRAIQANREVAGIDQLITRFASIQTDRSDIGREAAIEEILSILYDLFHPFALGIFIDAGFKSNPSVFPKDHKLSGDIEKYLESNDPAVREIRVGDASLIKNDLITPSSKGFDHNNRRIGALVAAVASETDDFNSPTLFTYHLLCRVATNLVADAYLDLARDYFGRQLKDLTISLNASSNRNIATWFEVVSSKIRSMDLLWVAVSKNDSPMEIIGAHRDQLRALIAQINAGQIVDDDRADDSIKLYQPLSQMKDGTKHIIKLELSEFGGALWVGVEREGFGPEIAHDTISPWKTFLDRIREISDAFLVQIIDHENQEKHAKEAAEFHGLATAAVTTGTLLHQIGNQVRDVKAPAESIYESLRMGDMTGSVSSWRTVNTVIEESKKLFGLSRMLSGVVKVDSHRPCTLIDILEESGKLFQGALNMYSIRLKSNISNEILRSEVDVPFYVGTFAVTNLIINAKDAVKNREQSDGVITLDGERTDTAILLHVSDNGPGVPSAMRKSIFEKGVTTRPDGSGLGLYFTARSLSENGGLVELRPSKNGARFIIHFPLPSTGRATN